jgi:polyphosphate glucokinase
MIFQAARRNAAPFRTFREASMKILVVDIGGTNIKLKLGTGGEVRRFPSGPEMTPTMLADGIRQLTPDWDYEAATIGYPGPVVQGRIHLEPVNLGRGWVGFDFDHAFGKPVRIINDAAMQALGSYEGGRMLFLGLGTGLGSCLIVDGTVAPLELAHLPYRKNKSFEQYVGQAARKRRGNSKWQASVHDVVARLRAAMVADYVVLGGGNAKKLTELPPNSRPGDNNNAFVGGVRLWEK